jgi:COP9 signalosome complex subunit 7
VQILAYADLQPALDLPTIRALEDLIIDGIYAGILRARLDQRLQRAEVEYVLGRDVSPAGVPALLAALTDWARTTDDVLGALDTRLAALRTDQAAADAAAAAHRAAVDGRIKEVQEKREKATGTGKGGPATRAAANTADLRGDDMDVDDDGLARASGASKGRKTGRGDENKGVFSRFSKRNRM